MAGWDFLPPGRIRANWLLGSTLTQCKVYITSYHVYITFRTAGIGDGPASEPRPADPYGMAAASPASATSSSRAR